MIWLARAWALFRCTEYEERVIAAEFEMAKESDTDSFRYKLLAVSRDAAYCCASYWRVAYEERLSLIKVVKLELAMRKGFTWDEWKEWGAS